MNALSLTALTSSFQQAVLRNINDKNAQLQKQIDSVVREGEFMYLVFVGRPDVRCAVSEWRNKSVGQQNFRFGWVEIIVLHPCQTKINAELERDLELERRKTRELQDATRERDKEYQKLKVNL